MPVDIITGDALAELRKLPSGSVHCCITSPPYFGLRDYGHAGQIGLEATPDAFVAELVAVFREVRRVLRGDGTLWLNLGDSYAGSGRGGNPTEASSTLEGGQGSQRASMVKRSRGADEIGQTARTAAVTNTGRRATRNLPTRFDPDAGEDGRIHTAYAPAPRGLKQKDLIGIPWMVAFALRADGWYLRQDIIWSKPNPMPESVTDRCTKAHEYLFLLSKSERYYYDDVAVAEPAAYAPGCGWEEEAKGTRPGKRGVAQERPIDPEQSFRAIRATRNKRSVWTIATAPYPQAHFATFPPSLVEPCIKAGTSERGCCPKCRSPWARVVGIVDTGATQKMPDGMATYAGGHTAVHRDGREAGAPGNPVVETITLGWWPSCRCEGFDATLPAYPKKPSRAKLDDEAAYQRGVQLWLGDCERANARISNMCRAVSGRMLIPAIVLDPFGGAGTTGLVADRLQRDALLIELKPEYADMARRRIDGDAPLFSRAAE